MLPIRAAAKSNQKGYNLLDSSAFSVRMIFDIKINSHSMRKKEKADECSGWKAGPRI